MKNLERIKEKENWIAWIDAYDLQKCCSELCKYDFPKILWFLWFPKEKGNTNCKTIKNWNLKHFYKGKRKFKKAALIWAQVIFQTIFLLLTFQRKKEKQVILFSKILCMKHFTMEKGKSKLLPLTVLKWFFKTFLSSSYFEGKRKNKIAAPNLSLMIFFRIKLNTFF